LMNLIYLNENIKMKYAGNVLRRGKGDEGE
jgi:hypothetical protein